MSKKECLKYYFSVEGETEKWYLDWLQDKINHCKSTENMVKFDTKIMKNPVKRVKSLNIITKIELIHVFDFEDLHNETAFQNTLSYMKKASTIKNIKYLLGYYNYSFDLWVILHKKNESASKNHRNQYLKVINDCYETSFESMAKYKEENNFKKLLNKLQIEDVIFAIKTQKK